ncbi:hydrogen peroxide-dependent heme synthase [Kineococcus sp. SYSU DK001]|uniref:hydrogen peroxide-dependent heme synthase n=1 Tax=Kineococcus sp. SYSU DK001 TaxID=3383122 RepID=UPI003D7F0E68
MPEAQTSAPQNPTADQINDTIAYTMWSVFAAETPLGENDRAAYAREVQDLLDELVGKGLVVRGLYDVAGLRADADLMFWWYAPTIELVQEAYRRLRTTRLGKHLAPVWSVVGLHRPAEFNRGHVPAFMSGDRARDYVCVYPFVRSYEWYLLPEEERRKMLRDHGLAARTYEDVRANTVSAFALGDYEWILAFEADELHRIVDLMRDLRNTEARRHVREEVPFFTGPKVELGELVNALP